MDALPALRALREGRPELWPFPDGATDRLLVGGSVGPRALLARASRELERLRGGRDEPLAVEAFLAAELDRRLEAARARPSDVEATLAHGLPLLFGLGTSAWSVSKTPSPRDVVLRLENGERKLDVAVCNQRDGRSVRYPLARLSQSFDQEQAGLRIIRDAARPDPPRGQKSIETFATLIERGARKVHPRAEAMAAMEALRTLLSEAKAGDLNAQGEPLSVATVSAWLKEQFQAELAELPRFMEALVDADSAEEEVDSSLLVELRALVDDRRIIEVGAAAQALKASPKRLETLAASDDGLGLVVGVPAILFAPRELRLGAVSTEGV